MGYRTKIIKIMHCVTVGCPSLAAMTDDRSVVTLAEDAQRRSPAHGIAVKLRAIGLFAAMWVGLQSDNPALTDHLSD